ncbi:pseudouridine-5'-phosphate glycosidase [Thermocrispum agreste]|uniref:pseudouridine-5'-phosphate glycosidase n=1 Tax=Thermocrispum agreste TaxID=37925 RepID=UPI00056E253D|nr:pseudouridine-5'-phosphate glycosidase [Thermocrispum agreste]
MSNEVADAVAAGRPVVALESTLLAHGFPPGDNLSIARRLEEVVRAEGAVPATIAVLSGTPTVGLTGDQIHALCTGDDVVKLSTRDLGPAVALGRTGATTVASTSALAHATGIRVFATGGLGGVHRPVGDSQVSWDVSADIDALATTGVLVVSSGVKSVLDVPATLEALETRSVPVVGYRTDDFPAFYLRSSGHRVSWRVESPAEAAAVFAAHSRISSSGMLLANPVPADAEMDHELHERLLREAMTLLHDRSVQGSDVTPAMLEHFHRASEGVSVRVNEALVLVNARLAAQVAVALAGH